MRRLFQGRRVGNLIEIWLEDFIARFIPKSVQSIVPKSVQSIVGKTVLVCWVIFSACNLCFILASGLLYLSVRGPQPSGWHSYTEHPIEFVIWTGIYSLSIVLAVLAIRGYVREKRQIKRAVFKALANESGPPPVKRQWDS